VVERATSARSLHIEAILLFVFLFLPMILPEVSRLFGIMRQEVAMDATWSGVNGVTVSIAVDDPSAHPYGAVVVADRWSKGLIC
jgi:ABC-type uncharacterized transport system YnjBCD permease subunit